MDELAGVTPEFQCGDCPPGLQGDGETCYDVNECQSNTTNDCDQTCHNILNGYYCSCDDGFTLSLDKHSCIDNAGCTPTAMNNTGSPNCTCDPGYEFDNGTCSDFDECSEGVQNDCPEVSTCINTDGDYFCNCMDGYNTVNETKSCEDIDECATGNHMCNGSLNRVCMNTVGNHTCICNTSYALVDGSCESANSYTLELRFDFINDIAIQHYTDTEQNRNRLAEQVFDQLNSTSVIGDGNLADVIVTNYTVVGGNAFVEFRIDSFNSELNATFLDSVFTDSLPPNRVFGLNNRIVEQDVNECLVFTDACRNGNCMNTYGSFYCTCNEGFLGTGTDSCEDIIECLGENDCQQICYNEEGGYSCACWDGYEMDGSGFNCTDIDECSRNSSACENGMCMNLVGSFNCSCNSGYELSNDNITCSDINECLQGADECQQICSNEEGGYSCACWDGYEFDEGGLNCTDIDECSRNSSACENGMCMNLIGSFNCSCNSGYEISNDNITCSDINECSASPSVCDSENGVCTNSMGSYNCSCTPGYELSTDGITCNVTSGATTMQPETTPSATSQLVSPSATSMQPETTPGATSQFVPSSATSMQPETTPGATSQLVSSSATTMQPQATTMQPQATPSATSQPVSLSATTMQHQATPSATSEPVSSSATTMQPQATTMQPQATSSATSQPVSSSVTTMQPETTSSATTQFDVGIVLEIIFENTFQNDLADPLSTAFMDLANALCNRLTEYFRRLTSDDIRCEVIRFRNGSVVADVNLTFPANDASQAQNIMDNVGIVTAMDIGNIIVNNDIYFPTAINSNVPEPTTMQTETTTEPQGLSNGAIIAIVLGVLAGLLVIIVFTCGFLIQASRRNAAKFAVGEAYHGPYSRQTPAPSFYGDDPWEDSGSYNSLDRREFAVSRAVERLAHDRERRQENVQFQTPYVVGGDDNRGVERNPFYY
eukprot:XP_011663339.1 PREDICTED: fibrillin-1 isoform X1 [Strongylocentrotus purpuratus]